MPDTNYKSSTTGLATTGGILSAVMPPMKVIIIYEIIITKNIKNQINDDQGMNVSPYRNSVHKEIRNNNAIQCIVNSYNYK